jgi:hypothetical protein
MFLAQSPDAQLVTLQALRNAECLDIKRLFCNLSAPSMSMLCGEYNAELLDQGGRFANYMIGFAFGMGGKWVGKGFDPRDATTGVGYNCFATSAGNIRKLPMRTELRLSDLDDRDSFMIDYGHDNRGLIQGLSGEIRQLTPRVMIGIGIYQVTLGPILFQRRLIPFMLFEPSCENQADSV